LGDVLVARVAAQISIAWLDEQQTEGAAAQLERMQQLIRKLDEILDEIAAGIRDDVEYDEEAIAMVTTHRSIH
jgi:hypothetical protein